MNASVSSSGGQFERRDQGNGWGGNFAPVRAGERLGADEWQTVQKTEEGKGWRHYSEVSKRNSYTRAGLGEITRKQQEPNTKKSITRLVDSG